MAERVFPYWLEVPLLKGDTTQPPSQASIVIVGSGFAGASLGYFLQKQGFDDIVIVDDNPEKAASFRNCGHILYGTVESMKAFTEIHGLEKATQLWSYSIEICDLIGKTVSELGASVDYRRDGYLVVAVSEAEDRECRESVRLLNEAGFQSDYVEPSVVSDLGFKNVFGARFEKGSAQAHPTKFRNALMEAFLKNGGKYFSGRRVKSVEEVGGAACINGEDFEIKADAVALCGSAYSPLFSSFFEARRLVEPFRGQIITSKRLNHDFKVRYPHSFDHGYEYSLVTEDNRLMLGGWRNNTETKEIGIYNLDPNPKVTDGLKEFAQRHYRISTPIEWEYVWTGIMDASQTSLPFIGPTNSDRIFSCAGWTGHGFSWAHGCAKLLSEIMAGAPVPEVAKYFSPKFRH
jgi:glycine/D-amino acid oxidase-like deaminating enzyme